jgi:dihydroorotate dehydrogenase (NAD+) catalytic subunit
VHKVFQVAHPHNIPIIGQGGIVSCDDAIEFLIAGASAVGLGTGLFYDPMLCAKINSGLLDYLNVNRIENVSKLVGTLTLN